jgi:biofilm protein TabA
MILDELRNARVYNGLGPLFARALAFLQKTDLARLPSGRHEIEGDALFAIVDESPTKPLEQCAYEAHRKYWDIQYVISGVERMGYAPAASMKVIKPYDPEKDIMFLDGKGDLLTVNAGMFAVFGPQDAHRPKVAVDAPAPERKIVVKVAAGTTSRRASADTRRPGEPQLRTRE